jgi:glycosyltransferase involved in cell wall biosynthesis
MADRLLPFGVRTIVAYPAIGEPPRPLAGSAAIPVALDTQLLTRDGRATMVEFIRRENVNVVYFTDRPQWSVWYRSLRRAGARRIIVHDHTSGTRNMPTGVRRAVKRLAVNLPGVAADLVVAVSNFVAERDRSAAVVSPERVRCIWNGLDPVPPGSEEQQPDVRRLLGLGPNTRVIGCACRATPEKGVKVLFNAFDRLVRISSRETVLVYIGSGPEINELSELRERLPSANSIFMLGYLPNAASLLRTANVCVIPSLWQEAFSLAVLEMMVRGRAVVASNVGGVPELIEDRVSGILVVPNDVDALAKAITEVLGSESYQDALGTAARERASRLFSAERQITAMLGTFQDVFLT